MAGELRDHTAVPGVVDRRQPVRRGGRDPPSPGAEGSVVDGTDGAGATDKK